MFPKILTQIFGSRNERLLKGYRRTVAQINALEPQFEALDDVGYEVVGAATRGMLMSMFLLPFALIVNVSLSTPELAIPPYVSPLRTPAG